PLGPTRGHTLTLLGPVRIGRPVSHRTSSAYSHQWRPTVLGMIQALFGIVEGAAREQISYLSGDGCFQRFFARGADQISHAFRCFERHVADESVANNYIHLAAVDVPPFNITDKVQSQLLQQHER